MSHVRVRVGQVLFRHRGWLPVPFFALALLARCPSRISLGVGLIALFVGEVLRIWSVAHAGLTTRARHITAPRLALGGPYGFVRHPIYVGNFLVGLGFVGLLTAHPWIWMAYTVLFWLEYTLITDAEEAFLLSRFDTYRTYREKVPRFLPYRGKAWPEGERGDLAMALRSERSTFLLLLAFLGLALLKRVLVCP